MDIYFSMNPKTITYRLSDLLMMSFLTILSNGVNSFWGIADHVRVCHEKYEEYGLLKDGRYPSHDTFRRVFSLINPQSLYEQTLQVFYDLHKKHTCLRQDKRDSHSPGFPSGIQFKKHCGYRGCPALSARDSRYNLKKQGHLCPAGKR